MREYDMAKDVYLAVLQILLNKGADAHSAVLSARDAVAVYRELFPSE